MDNVWLHNFDTPPYEYLSPRDVCERCPNDGADKTEVCGCLTVYVCRCCIRELECDPVYRELQGAKVRANVQLNTLIKAGDAEGADAAWCTYDRAEAAAFQHVVSWLKIQVSRDGATRADRIAALTKKSSHSAWRRRLGGSAGESISNESLASEARDLLDGMGEKEG